MELKEFCPLCKGDNRIEIENIDVGCINKFYSRKYAIENAVKNDVLTYRTCGSCGLSFFIANESGTPEVFEMLQSNSGYYPGVKQEFNLIAPKISSDSSVLEIGAGRGVFADIIGIDQYVGLEYNDLAIERAKEKGIKLLKESIEEHSKNNKNMYDTVISFQVLEHVKDPRSFIESAIECLKEDGMLILAVPNHEGFMGKSINNILDLPPHHITHWNKKVFEYISDKFDLKLLEFICEPVANEHRIPAKKAIIQEKIRTILGIGYRIVDCGIVSQLTSVFSSLLARTLPINLDKVIGHTIIAVYKK